MESRVEAKPVCSWNCPTRSPHHLPITATGLHVHTWPKSTLILRDFHKRDCIQICDSLTTWLQASSLSPPHITLWYTHTHTHLQTHTHKHKEYEREPKKGNLRCSEKLKHWKLLPFLLLSIVLFCFNILFSRLQRRPLFFHTFSSVPPLVLLVLFGVYVWCMWPNILRSPAYASHHPVWQLPLSWPWAMWATWFLKWLTNCILSFIIEGGDQNHSTWDITVTARQTRQR